MINLFIVSPLEAGWCLKIASTGEVIAFKTCGMAQRRGLALAAQAAAHGIMAEVHVVEAGGRLVGRWIEGQFHAQVTTDNVGQLAA